MRIVRAVGLGGVVVLLFALAAFAGGVETNILTFENQSGQTALVKLIGPTKRVVTVRNEESESVQVAAGSYFILVRYGDRPPYRYARGDVFEIERVMGGYVRAVLTLHGVVNGNYRSFSSTESEFESY